MAGKLDPKARINLEKASILLMEPNQHGLAILVQIMRGFGAHNLHRATDPQEARDIIRHATVDLIIADPNTKVGDGHEFMRWLRRSEHEKNRFAPLILTSGHATMTTVRKARDTGSNFFVAKPLNSQTMLERVMWVARDNRPFVEVASYVGPDRRFKFEGPPPGVEGRRDGDLSTDAQGEEEQTSLYKAS